ncbi:MAG: inositol monophosphatase, partial [Candidatus Tectomicrobia bacterium]|nr:inositol monophosphatase [Candidatus Tectomicrobia bacterium]
MDIEFIRTLSLEAGAMALNYFGHTTKTLKPDHTIVTQADVEIEQFLRREISRRYPAHPIMGEEGKNPSKIDSEFVWALDPIDGTRAFSHGFPIWGVSIGLLRDGLPFLGAVYLPYLKELYDTDGVHAFLNRERLPQPHVELNENAGFIVTETIYRRWKIDFQGAIFSLGSVAAH